MSYAAFSSAETFDLSRPHVCVHFEAVPCVQSGAPGGSQTASAGRREHSEPRAVAYQRSPAERLSSANVMFGISFRSCASN
jgi:hypothetical protein